MPGYTVIVDRTRVSCTPTVAVECRRSRDVAVIVTRVTRNHGSEDIRRRADGRVVAVVVAPRYLFGMSDLRSGDTRARTTRSKVVALCQSAL